MTVMQSQGIRILRVFRLKKQIFNTIANQNLALLYRFKNFYKNVAA